MARGSTMESRFAIFPVADRRDMLLPRYFPERTETTFEAEFADIKIPGRKIAAHQFVAGGDRQIDIEMAFDLEPEASGLLGQPTSRAVTGSTPDGAAEWVRRNIPPFNPGGAFSKGQKLRFAPVFRIAWFKTLRTLDVIIRQATVTDEQLTELGVRSRLSVRLSASVHEALAYKDPWKSAGDAASAARLGESLGARTAEGGPEETMAMWEGPTDEALLAETARVARTEAQFAVDDAKEALAERVRVRGGTEQIRGSDAAEDLGMAADVLTDAVDAAQDTMIFVGDVEDIVVPPTEAATEGDAQDYVLPKDTMIFQPPEDSILTEESAEWAAEVEAADVADAVAEGDAVAAARKEATSTPDAVMAVTLTEVLAEAAAAETADVAERVGRGVDIWKESVADAGTDQAEWAGRLVETVAADVVDVAVGAAAAAKAAAGAADAAAEAIAASPEAVILGVLMEDAVGDPQPPPERPIKDSDRR